jgi:glycosyltransferase involved in cell wall biosynthesis
MKISVLINNYNYARFLPEAINSINQQTRKADEIIVVDDGSTDESLITLDKLRVSNSSLKVISQPNGGQLSAFRAGILASSGDWLCFLDADDTWEPTHLSAAERAIASEPELGVYYSGHKETSGPAIFRSKWPPGSVGPCAGLVAARGTRIGTITSALCLKREFAALAVELDPSFDAEWRTRADDCLVFGALIAGAIFHYDPIQSVNYRVHGENSFADKLQDSYMVYRYDLRKWRMIVEYCHRCGVRRDDLFTLVMWEFGAFPRNRKHEYNKKIYLQALRRTHAPMWRKAKVLLKLIKGKYR